MKRTRHQRGIAVQKKRFGEMSKELLGFVISVGETFMKSIPISLGLAAVFIVLAYFWACNPGRPWWQKRDIVTDLCYWFFIPVFARYFRICLLVAGAAGLRA